MIDRTHIGYEAEPLTVEVEKGRLRFAKATGQTDPIYLDEAAAKAAGYPALPAPPTFMVSLELESPEPFKLFEVLGVDLNRILHGEQAFQYLKPICAGDTITLRPKVVDIYDKKGGAMEFIVITTTATNQHDETVGSAHQNDCGEELTMVAITYESIQVGDELPALTTDPINRTQALFAGASGDHNPIHLDIDLRTRRE
ncbi:MAG: MaoC family dehydratase N-terminal domain-containing protein [Thiolinea sp.]